MSRASEQHRAATGDAAKAAEERAQAAETHLATLAEQLVVAEQRATNAERRAAQLESLLATQHPHGQARRSAAGTSAPHNLAATVGKQTAAGGGPSASAELAMAASPPNCPTSAFAAVPPAFEHLQRALEQERAANAALREKVEEDERQLADMRRRQFDMVNATAGGAGEHSRLTKLTAQVSQLQRRLTEMEMREVTVSLIPDEDGDSRCLDGYGSDGRLLDGGLDGGQRHDSSHDGQQDGGLAGYQDGSLYPHPSATSDANNVRNNAGGGDGSPACEASAALEAMALSLSRAKSKQGRGSRPSTPAAAAGAVHGKLGSLLAAVRRSH